MIKLNTLKERLLISTIDNYWYYMSAFNKQIHTDIRDKVPRMLSPMYGDFAGFFILDCDAEITVFFGEDHFALHII